MNPAVLALAKLVRDLLGVDEQTVRIGRTDKIQGDPRAATIAVDQLGPASKLSHLESFDGDEEELEIGGMFRAPCTVNFYGDDAYGRALAFVLKSRSQRASDLKEALGVAVYQASDLTDVGQLFGQQHGQRVEVEMNVIYCHNALIETLRIDAAQLEIRSEQGIEYVGEH